MSKESAARKELLREFVDRTYGLDATKPRGFKARLSLADSVKLANFALSAMALETPVIAAHRRKELGL